MNFLKAMFGNYSKREVKRIQPIADKVLALESKYAAMSESPDGEISIVVASTNIDDTSLTLNFEKSLQGKTFYRHVYAPYDIVCTTEGELINPDLKLTNTTTALKDVVKPFNVVVYTTKKLVK